MNKTKIIATIGPSSDHPNIISKLIKSGMNVARINMAHCKDQKYLKQLVYNIRNEASKLNVHIGILMDIAGPKIRLELDSVSNKGFEVKKNKVYQLGYSKRNDLPINVELVFKNIYTKNSYVKVDDGKINFKVIDIEVDSIKIKALEDGVLFDNKGINFPGVNIDIPCLTSKDIRDINYAIEENVDWLALSFVRHSKDILPMKKILNKHNCKIPIIAKVEKPEAINNLDEIIDIFDGVLIARGDLGVEMRLSKLPALQRSIIEKCRYREKPVVIATQMLESMINNNQPTRAEVTDVANAVYQGADAVMLSGETAIGDYPIETVEIMKEIIINAEQDNLNNLNKISTEKLNDNRNAIGNAIKVINKCIDIDAVVIMTESGLTSIIVSHFRPKANLYALTPNENICKRLTLIWGLVPIISPKFLSTDDMIVGAERILRDKGYIKKDNVFLLTSGVPVGVTGSTNMLKIHKVND